MALAAMVYKKSKVKHDMRTRAEAEGTAVPDWDSKQQETKQLINEEIYNLVKADPVKWGDWGVRHSLLTLVIGQ
jgi:hypothetical protein